MIKNYFSFLCIFLLSLTVGAQIKPAGVSIMDDMQKIGQNSSVTKRSIQNPKTCTVDTSEYPRYKATNLVTISIAKGRSLGQLYSCPKPVSITGFTFYAFVLPVHKTSKSMQVYCRLYKAGPDSLPSGSPLRSDTLSIDSTLGAGLLSVIEKHANWQSITLDSNYIITVETNDDSLSAGVVTNNYQYRDGEGMNLNCGSISGLWYNGRNLNVGGLPFDCDILLHPHVQYNFGTDFSIKNNCYNINDSIKFGNAAPFNISGSKMYNRYLNYNLGYFCHLWDLGNFSGQQYTVDNKVKYSVKKNYNVRLISTVYGYRGPMMNGCTDTTIKEILFKPDIPTFQGLVNVCIGDTASFTAVSNDTGLVFEWLATPSSQTPFHTGKVYRKFPVSKNDTFYLRANNKGCLSGLRTVIIKANAYPTSLNVLNDSVCAGSKANLKAQSNIGTINWYTSANGGLPFFNGEVYQTGILNKDTSFWVQAGNNGCNMSPRVKVSALVGSNFAPSAPVVSNDTTVCLASGNVLTLNATAGTGLTVRWFNAASGGSSIHTGNNFNFLPVKREIKTFYADAFNGVCGSTRVPINITVEDYPSISNIVNQAVCKGDSSRISFSLPYGDAYWYDAASGGMLLNGGQSYVSLEVASTDYFIETVSSVCVNPVRTKITAVVNQAPAVIKLWGDTICAKNKATLKTVLGGPGVMEWFDSDTSSAVLGTGNFFQTPVLNGNRKYYARPVYAGCTGQRVSVQPLVKPAPFSGFSFEVLTWQQVRVSPINAGGASIKWYFGDGNTSNNSDVTHRYQNTGTYQIKLVLTSLSTGCKDSTIVTVQIDPSSINGVQYSSGLSVYPNPAGDFLNVHPNETVFEDSKVYIYSISGAMVLCIENVSGTPIDISSLEPGIYLIKTGTFKPVLFLKQ